jgi:hypothetical protein
MAPAAFRLYWRFRSQVLRADVTEHPTASWISQQLREAFPDGATPKYLILDRDSTFDRQVLVSVENMTIKPVRTAFRSPHRYQLHRRNRGRRHDGLRARVHDVTPLKDERTRRTERHS